jgi:hypothetical protein
MIFNCLCGMGDMIEKRHKNIHTKYFRALIVSLSHLEKRLFLLYAIKCFVNLAREFHSKLISWLPIDLSAAAAAAPERVCMNNHIFFVAFSISSALALLKFNIFIYFNII